MLIFNRHCRNLTGHVIPHLGLDRIEFDRQTELVCGDGKFACLHVSHRLGTNAAVYSAHIRFCGLVKYKKQSSCDNGNLVGTCDNNMHLCSIRNPANDHNSGFLDMWGSIIAFEPSLHRVSSRFRKELLHPRMQISSNWPFIVCPSPSELRLHHNS